MVGRTNISQLKGVFFIKSRLPLFVGLVQNWFEVTNIICGLVFKKRQMVRFGGKWRFYSPIPSQHTTILISPLLPWPSLFSLHLCASFSSSSFFPSCSSSLTPPIAQKKISTARSRGIHLRLSTSLLSCERPLYFFKGPSTTAWRHDASARFVFFLYVYVSPCLH